MHAVLQRGDLIVGSHAFDKSVSIIPTTPLSSKHFVHRSTSLKRACCVLYVSLKPNKRFDKVLFSERQHF